MLLPNLSCPQFSSLLLYCFPTNKDDDDDDDGNHIQVLTVLTSCVSILLVNVPRLVISTDDEVTFSCFPPHVSLLIHPSFHAPFSNVSSSFPLPLRFLFPVHRSFLRPCLCTDAKHKTRGGGHANGTQILSRFKISSTKIPLKIHQTTPFQAKKHHFYGDEA